MSGHLSRLRPLPCENGSTFGRVPPFHREIILAANDAPGEAWPPCGMECAVIAQRRHGCAADRLAAVYAIPDLEKALTEQLAGQYMQHDNCRAGCLLVTMNKTRHWDCPDTGARLNFEAVLARLRTQAAELEIRMNHEVRLAVVGIDLTEAV